MKSLLAKDSFSKACFLLGWLMLWPMLFADDDARRHLEQAYWRMTSQTMQVTERVIQDTTVTEYLIWQRKNPDGTVERILERLKEGERLAPETLKIGQRVFRVYYTKEGRTALWIGENTTRGIRSQRRIPVPKFRRECEITEGKRVYDGQFCWDIVVRRPPADNGGPPVEEYLVSGTSQMILVCRKFDVDGRLLTEEQYRDYDFSPNFPEGIFDLPAAVVVRELSDGEDETGLREELKEEEESEKAELYKRKDLQDLKADLRYWAQGTVACLLTMVTWAGVPLALLVAAFVLRRRRRVGRERN